MNAPNAIRIRSEERTVMGMNKAKWMILLVAWIGWGFDVFDGLLFIYVAPNCVPTLLHLQIGSPQAQSATLAWVGGLTSLLLLGWCLGGIFFGWLDSRIGHMPTLLLTMALYSLGTALCAAAPNIWILALCRLVASLGIGGEWAAGAALVAETVPPQRRVEAGALIYTASPMGLCLAGLVNYEIAGVYFKAHPEVSWRYVFLFGLFPACIALILRLSSLNRERRNATSVTPIEASAAASHNRSKHGSPEEADPIRPQLSDLFKRKHCNPDGRASVASLTGGNTGLDELEVTNLRTSARKVIDLPTRTLSGFLMALIALITWWSTNAFIPIVGTGLARQSAKLHGLDAAATAALGEQWKAAATNNFNLGGLIGILLTVPIALKWGRKPMFAIYFAASALSLLAAFGLNLPPQTRLLMYLPIGLSVFGIFSSFTFYLPELFPWRLASHGSRVLLQCGAHPCRHWAVPGGLHRLIGHECPGKRADSALLDRLRSRCRTAHASLGTRNARLAIPNAAFHRQITWDYCRFVTLVTVHHQDAKNTKKNKREDFVKLQEKRN